MLSKLPSVYVYHLAVQYIQYILFDFKNHEQEIKYVLSET